MRRDSLLRNCMSKLWILSVCLSVCDFFLQRLLVPQRFRKVLSPSQCWLHACTLVYRWRSLLKCRRRWAVRSWTSSEPLTAPRNSKGSEGLMTARRACSPAGRWISTSRSILSFLTMKEDLLSSASLLITLLEIKVSFESLRLFCPIFAVKYVNMCIFYVRTRSCRCAKLSSFRQISIIIISVVGEVFHLLLLWSIKKV